MTYSIRLTLAALGTALLMACSSGEPDSSANPLLVHVPADTPFVMANLAPLPEDIIMAYLERYSPALMSLQDDMDQLRVSLETEQGKDADLMRAIVQELDGNMTPAGLENLGLSLSSMHVMYGYGLSPVVRLGLSDRQKFRDMLGRVASNADIELKPQISGLSEYWRLGGEGDAPAVYIALVEQHIAVGTAPPTDEQAFLDHLLGEALPADSLANSRALGELEQDKGYLPYMLGYIDTAQMVNQAFDPAFMGNALLQKKGLPGLYEMDPACADEARLVSALVPRLTLGNTALTDDTVGLQFQVETIDWLGNQLADLVSDVSPASEGEHLASLAMGLRMGGLRNFLLEQSANLTQFQFQCPALQGLNQQVLNLNQQLNQPMPPFINNLLGLRMVLNDINPLDPQPANARGMVSLNMDKPQMVVGMASMMVPGFEDLNIEPGADPVQLPQELLDVVTPDFEIYGMMTKQAIGLSLGKDQKQALPAFMDENQNNQGTFLSFEVDASKLMDMIDADMIDASMLDPGASGSMDDQEFQNMMQAYEATQGKTRMEFRFQADGLVIDSVQVFP